MRKQAIILLQRLLKLFTYFRPLSSRRQFRSLHRIFRCRPGFSHGFCKSNGCVMVIVGAVEPIEPGVDGSKLIFKRRSIAGSLIGGLKETQEMLNFCAEHNVLPQVEMIPIQKINEAFQRTIKNDVKYRFVIDMASLREESA